MTNLLDRRKLTTWRLDRLSLEWVGPIVVAVDGDPVSNWTYVILHEWDRPADAAAINKVPTATDEGLGVLVGPTSPDPLSRGSYLVWARHVGVLEAPVFWAFAQIIIN